jgi:hypothetical protein
MSSGKFILHSAMKYYFGSMLILFINAEQSGSYYKITIDYALFLFSILTPPSKLIGKDAYQAPQHDVTQDDL